MNDKQIIWTTSQLKILLDYIDENTPLDQDAWDYAVKIAGKITTSSKNNEKVARAVTGLLGAVQQVYKKG